MERILNNFFLQFIMKIVNMLEKLYENYDKIYGETPKEDRILTIDKLVDLLKKAYMKKFVDTPQIGEILKK